MHDVLTLWVLMKSFATKLVDDVPIAGSGCRCVV